MEKPKKPIEPKIENYPIPTEPTGKNYLGNPIYERLDWIRDYKKYQQDLIVYQSEMDIYQQLKLIRLVKNSSEKYCLKNLKIVRQPK